MPLDNLPPQARKTVQLSLLLTGIILMTVGSYMLVDPEAVNALIKLDTDTTTILGGALILCGTVDTVLSLIIFRKKERR